MYKKFSILLLVFLKKDFILLFGLDHRQHLHFASLFLWVSSSTETATKRPSSFDSLDHQVHSPSSFGPSNFLYFNRPLTGTLFVRSKAWMSTLIRLVPIDGPLWWPSTLGLTRNLDQLTNFESGFPKIIFNSVTVVLYHIPIRYLLLAWGTKKLSIYGIKPNYKDNNELLGKTFIFEWSFSSRNSETQKLKTSKFEDSLFEVLEIRRVIFRRPRNSEISNLFFDFRFLVQNPNDTRIETLQIRNCD